MSTRAARFLGAAADARQIAKLGWSHHPEVAVAGRSNVGKSALLNRLIGQRHLARVSRTPGRTQQLNFFLIDDRLVLADLPGYGFARVPAALQAQWKTLIETYLTRRRNLRAVAVLVDLRRNIEADDAALLDFLNAHRIPALVVGTKADKLPYGARLRRVRALQASVPAEAAALVVCSATSGEGVEELWNAIQRLAQVDPVVASPPSARRISGRPSPARTLDDRPRRSTP